MPTQGSWRPSVSTTVGLALQVDRAARAADRAGRLDRERDGDVLAGRDAAEDAAGVVGEKAGRRQLVAVRRAALLDRLEAGADLDALDRVDPHHRVGDVGVELVVERLAEADRHAARDDVDARAAAVAVLAQLVHVGLEAGDVARVGGEERVVRHVLHALERDRDRADLRHVAGERRAAAARAATCARSPRRRPPAR